MSNGDESYGSGTTPRLADTERMLLVKLIIAEGGGSGGGGGSGARQVYQSAGNPNGSVLVNTTFTCYCIDTLNNVGWVKTDGVISNTGWVLV